MPQYGNYDAEINNQISRYDFSQIIASKRELALIRPVRLVYSAATGYLAGTVLAQYTSGPNNGFFAAYNDAGASGLGTAMCVLLVDAVPASGDTVAAPAVYSGILFYDALIGIDANGITDLKGRKVSDASGNNIFIF